MFTPVLVLRLLPRFIQPLRSIIVRCLPTWYRLSENLDTACKLLNSLQQTSADQIARDNDAMPLFHWMKENGIDDLEKDPVNVARRQIFLGLGSIHTTASAANHAIHDLCAHPELVAPLREELEQVVGRNGDLSKQVLMKLWKMDSFLSESQRVNPPFVSKLCSIHPNRKAG